MPRRQSRNPIRRHPSENRGKDVLVRYAEEIPLLNQMVSELPVGHELKPSSSATAK